MNIYTLMHILVISQQVKRNIWIYILIMAGVTYFIRVLPPVFL